MYEGKQFGIDLVLERGTHSVWSARVDFEDGSLNNPGRKQGRSTDRYDLVVVTVENQRWDVELLEILSEIGFGEGFDGVVTGFNSGDHALEPERIAQALRDFAAGTVGAVEWGAQIFPELRTIFLNVGTDFVEDFYRQTGGIIGGLEHERRNCADEDGFRNALGTVAPDIASDFAATRRMSDVYGILQILSLIHI